MFSRPVTRSAGFQACRFTGFLAGLASNFTNAPENSTPSGFGNPRHSRLGSLRYAGSRWICGFVLLAAALAASAQEKVTFQEHVLPIFENSCNKCHNPDKKKGDLDLTTFAALMRGGGSGAAVVSGDPDGSKLNRVMNHAEEPEMPPKSGKLPGKELDVIKRWISGGLLETSGSKAIVAKKPAIDLSVSSATLGKPDGPPPMPKQFLLDPVVSATKGTAPTGMATSPWAPLVAITGQKQVLLYNTETLDLLGILPFTEGAPSDLKFSRNGKILIVGGGVAGKSGRVVLWNVETSERITVLGDEYDTALAADLSPDQSRVALGGPGRLVKIYSTATGELLHKIKKHTDWVTALAFSPDGEKLASADRNGGISVWDPDNAQELFSLAGHKSGVTSVQWRNDGKVLASASEDGTAKLWEMTEGKQAKTWTPHGSGVLGFHWGMDGKFVSCGRDGQVAIWDANGNKTKSAAVTNDLPVRAVLSHDGHRVIAADWLGNVTVYSAKDAKAVGTLSLNPPALAAQIAAAEKELAEAKAKSADVAPIEAKLARFSSAKVYGEMQRLRDELVAQQAARDKLAANDKRAADKLSSEIAAKEKKLETLKAQLSAKL